MEPSLSKGSLAVFKTKTMIGLEDFLKLTLLQSIIRVRNVALRSRACVNQTSASSTDTAAESVVWISKNQKVRQKQ